MNNLIVAEQLHKLARLMELHQENPFKIKAISNAASIIEKLHDDITIHNYTQLAQIKGIGKNILEKIKEFLVEGKIKELEQYEKDTPESVIELLNIKGLGPAKVYKLWKEHAIADIPTLLDNCEKNKLAHIKGFGEKTQRTIIENTKFYLESKNKLQLGLALSLAHHIQNILKNHQISAEITGELRRHCETLSQIEFITTNDVPEKVYNEIKAQANIPIVIHSVKEETYPYQLFKSTGSHDFLNEIGFYELSNKNFSSEKVIFEHLDIPYLPPYQRESKKEHLGVRSPHLHPKQTIKINDFKGILHCHTNYSDGLNSVETLADYVREQGYDYLAICDHSQSAKYANGLSIERLFKQFEEIEAYNRHHPEFKILKGIESDIHKDGSLDYEDSILQQFDIVVASIHQHFDMTEEEATKRLIKAIEHPYTNILGHMTGRLLLIRKGYPVNHKKIIDACAANNVVIELNANTYRLDIDWRWLQYCMEKGVKIAINPDAHEKTAIRDIQYGVMVAQKAGLTKEMCINTYNVKDLLECIKKL